MTQDKAGQLAALEAAINTGAMEIEYDGPNGKIRTRYRNFAQMAQTRDSLKRELGLMPKCTRRFGTFETDRGTGR